MNWLPDFYNLNGNVTAEEVSEALDQLVRFGLLEDASIEPPAALLPSDLERYASQIHLLSLLDTTGTQKYLLLILGGYHGTGAEVGPFVIPFRTVCLACEQSSRDPNEGIVAELAWIEQAAWLRHPNIHFVTALSAHHE